MNETHDDSMSGRIRDMIELVKELSKAGTPSEVLDTFANRWIDALGEHAAYLSLSTRGLDEGEFKVTRFVTAGRWREEKDDVAWKDSEALPAYAGGVISEIVRAGQPVVMSDLRVDEDEVFGDRLKGYRSLIAVPLYEHGEINNWAIELAEPASVYTEDTLEDMLLQANLIGGTVRHVLTAQQLQKANQEIEKEVQRIADIQHALLPERLPELDEARFAVSYQTFDHAGGDMYFFHKLADGRLAIMIGDVSGHGPAAAVVMAMVETLVSAYPQENLSAGEMMTFLNDQLCGKRMHQTFVTAFYAIFDPRTYTLRYSRAGHPPPLLRSIGRSAAYCILRDGDVCEEETNQPLHDADEIVVEQLDHAGGLPLGLFEGRRYEEAVLQLNDRQTIAFYTDGISETRNAVGKFFGSQGIIDALHACSGEADCAVSTILQHIKGFETGARPEDDQTLVVMQMR
ncbi:Phosphoserine phosphatase RsbU [Poriferisphaera corsica]|uniref:Phosphoserine phosphatase RsbU n=1 Tax=Poriferisphaera corsica TaxID=2528020 RepID=A0A517YQI3_9BACT|nr:SpoIIE family protein phosphatase [Poriferisphaera corsica]QDU32475.1 Phosphoserine phosphatase RsbU [Poriferisphaera corsica]